MFLTVQFQNRKMNVASMRLPPLPHKNSLRKLRIDSQKAALCLKYDLIKSIEAAETSTEEIAQPARYCEKTVTLKRPLSKESDVSIKSNRLRDSNSSTNTKKNTSLQLQHYSNIPPKVTAKSWVLYEMRQGRTLYSRRPRKQRQMASLTKMMNLITILQLMQKNMLFGKQIKIKATHLACSIEGTTAQLKVGCQYNLFDLLFGMMLPSGNDAAFLISQVGGYIIQNGCPQSWTDMNIALEKRQGSFMNSFLRQMNSLSQKIGMRGSNFANPHGLNNPQNYSCAQDLARLSTYAMKNRHFRKIVQTRRFQYSYFFPQDYPVENDSKKDIPAWFQEREWRGVWENTNRMLGVGWSGIKTGITPNAGPCLAASRTKILNGREYQFLVILLGSQSMEARWSQVANLVDWAINTRLYA